MERRIFIKNAAIAATSSLVLNAYGTNDVMASGKKKVKNSAKIAPRAITMWDFSWLERRWPGAGYENWDEALGGLKERGYNAVRIDAYPHLVAENPEKQLEGKRLYTVV